MSTDVQNGATGWMTMLAQNGGGVVMPGNPAQQAPGATTQPGQPGAQQQPGGLGPSFLFIILAFFVVMILTSFLGQRRERKRRAEMLSAVGKNDKVQTIGGVIGKVVEIRDDEVVLKVDENSNTRVTFSRSAIQQVLKSSGAAPEPVAEKK